MTLSPRELAIDVCARIRCALVNDGFLVVLSTLSNLDQIGLSGKEEYFKRFESSPSIPKLLGGALTILRYSEGES